MSQPDALLPASLWRRLAAMFYDALLLASLLFAVTAVGVGVQAALQGPDAIVAAHRPAASGPLLQLALAGTVYFFFGWCWTRSGQTLGMKTWRIRVVREDGTALGWGQSAARLLGACVSLACGGAGYWWCLFSRDGACWHDRWSRSRVVRLP